VVRIDTNLKYGLLLTVTLLLFACSEKQQPEVSAFDVVINDLSLSFFEHVPESATYYGAPGELAPSAHSRLNRRSAEGDKARNNALTLYLEKLKATDPTGLDQDQIRLRSSLIVLLDGALAPSRTVSYGTSFNAYGLWYLPYAISHDAGPTVEIPVLMEAQQTINDAREATDYIHRLDLFAGILDDALERLRAQVAIGAGPPDFLIEKSQQVVDAFAGTPADQNILYTSFVSKATESGIAGADDLASQVLEVVESGVVPAYQRVSEYLAEIKTSAPHDAGIWRLPNGDALYRAMIYHMTDSRIEPEVLHQTGLDEVVRITADMDRLFRAEGYSEGRVAERLAQLAADEQFIYPNNASGKAALLADIEEQIANATAALPQWFGALPKIDVDVRAMPEFSQDTAPGALYYSPAPDGSRPGIYFINLRDTALHPKFGMPTLTYHEAIPGHHMHAAVALDRDESFLTSAIYSNAVGEGWGLYAEALAAEMGLYAHDPFGDLGRLQAELYRAMRLVVDTGMHAMKWSREEAIDYMIATTGVSMSEAVQEIERYAATPAQALGYKVGMMSIQRLRQEAKAALGDSFDVREFHDRALVAASSALPVMEQEIRNWIDQTR
jgi:uncharacterized protein (DUF885 family)